MVDPADLLVERPGQFDLTVRVAVREVPVQALALFVGEVFGAGHECAADPVERVVGVAAPSQGRLLDTSSDVVEGVAAAHGLAFSVPDDIDKLPQSLQNIYKVLRSDCGIEPPSHGNLESWARQGVLLLNTALTVRRGKAGSHRRMGWETFTEAVIRAVSVAGAAQVVIFGSGAARYAGEAGPPPHDIDVLVVGKVDRADLYDAADRAQARLGIEVNPRRTYDEAAGRSG